VLDAAVSRALHKGVVTTFIHYPHPGNLLPTGLMGRTGDDEREADVHVLHYDYKIVFPRPYRELYETGESPSWEGYRPFLSISSTSPVAAGVVALMLERNPDLTPAQCKQIMMSTARPLTFEGQTVPRVVDAHAAVVRAQDLAE
jgi:subtilisin family serine protease